MSRHDESGRRGGQQGGWNQDRQHSQNWRGLDQDPGRNGGQRSSAGSNYGDWRDPGYDNDDGDRGRYESQGGRASQRHAGQGGYGGGYGGQRDIGRYGQGGGQSADFSGHYGAGGEGGWGNPGIQSRNFDAGGGWGGDDDGRQHSGGYRGYGGSEPQRDWATQGDARRGQGGQGESQHQGFDPDYHQWRSEQMRALDDDYRNWRQDRYQKFASEFSNWRQNRQQTGGSTPGTDRDNKGQSTASTTPAAASGEHATQSGGSKTK